MSFIYLFLYTHVAKLHKLGQLACCQTTNLQKLQSIPEFDGNYFYILSLVFEAVAWVSGFSEGGSGGQGKPPPPSPLGRPDTQVTLSFTGITGICRIKYWYLWFADIFRQLNHFVFVVLSGSAGKY